ncbi:MAG: hypothetical protein ACTSRP_06825 [Candidatus Helarchaeota archaeon]
MVFNLKLIHLELVDCTSDPHFIYLNDIDQLSKIIIDLCKSDIIKYIYQLKLIIKEGFKTVKYFDSGIYSSIKGKEGQVSSDYVKENKLAGPFYHKDSLFNYIKIETKIEKIMPGINGIKYCLEWVKNNFKKYIKSNRNISKFELRISVIYDKLKKHMEHDLIIVDFLNCNINIVNDWNHQDSPNYNKFISQIKEFFKSKNLELYNGVSIEY